MPSVLIWLLGGLAQLLQKEVPRLLMTLGIGFASYTGISAALDVLKANAISALQGLPSQIIAVLSLCKVDSGLTLIFSAWASVLALRIGTAGLTRLTMKGTAS